MKKLYIFITSLSLLVITQSSFSEIYKWVDKDGNVKFSDKKPPEKHQAEVIKLKINTVKVPKIYHNSLNDDYASTDNSKNKRSNSYNKIIMYSATWCGVCKTAKKYFNKKGVPFREYDVEKSVKGRKEFKRLKGRGVPIILIGKKRMDGFDRAYFERLFKS